MVIKCEVLRNLTYFIQVRIIGYLDEVGSIHVDELCAPFDAQHRPKKGSVFEAKVLNQKFDNKAQRNVWMLTMNISESNDLEKGETVMERALKNIKL